MFFSMFYCLCYITEISEDILEEQVLEERNTDLNEEEYIRMEDSREEHWMDVDEDGEYKSNIHALRWDLYTREKEDLIKREFLVSVPHLKGGKLFVLV